jgi:hypothetical protein
MSRKQQASQKFSENVRKAKTGLILVLVLVFEEREFPWQGAPCVEEILPIHK